MRGDVPRMAPRPSHRTRTKCSDSFSNIRSLRERDSSCSFYGVSRSSFIAFAKRNIESRGFVAADALFSVLDNKPVSSNPDLKLMFPLIQGVMAFDTPYNGLARAMFAYGAFSQYQNISSMWNVLSTVSTSVPAFLASAGSASASSSAASVDASRSNHQLSLENQQGEHIQH